MVTAMRAAEMGPGFLRFVPRRLLRAGTRWMLRRDDTRTRPMACRTFASWPPHCPPICRIVKENAERAGDFATCAASTLLLAGTATRPYLRAAVDALAAVMPNVRSVPLPGTDHGATQNRDAYGKPESSPPALARVLPAPDHRPQWPVVWCKQCAECRRRAGRAMNPSTALARVLVDELVACGLTEAVLAPGSRNAPLALALHDADAAGRLRLHVRIDERTAGFLALGLARGSGRPVAVVTTSGTAVANLHPAVLEASHGQVPLIVLSADRPPWLRDVGANQTVDQHGIFGPALRFFHEFAVPQDPGRAAGALAVDGRAGLVGGGRGRGGPAGPVQLNVPLAEPLMPDARPRLARAADRPGRALDQAPSRRPGATLGPALGAVPAPERGERVLFVADLTHPWAAPIADAGHLVIGEARRRRRRHGAGRRGPPAVGAADFLDHARPDRVIVLGRPTLFRPVQALLADPRVTVDAGRASGRLRRPGRDRAGGRPGPAGPADAARRASGPPGGATPTPRPARPSPSVLDGLDLSSSPRLARELVDLLPERATLVLGSSQPPGTSPCPPGPGTGCG